MRSHKYINIQLNKHVEQLSHQLNQNSQIMLCHRFSELDLTSVYF